MRSESRERLVLAADATARTLGGASLQEGIDMVRLWLAKLTEMLDAVQSPDLLAQGLERSEPAPELEELMIQAIENGPLFLRWIVMELHQSAEATIPRLPNREPAVSGREQVEILRFINQLSFEDNVQLGDAKKRAAQRFGCSVRTVERYWRERKTILANGPKYHFNDLLKELTNAIMDNGAS